MQLQPDRAVVRSAIADAAITIDAHGKGLQNVRGIAANELSNPADTSFPYGLFGFNVTGLAPGGNATVEVILPQGATPDSYYKQDPSTGELQPFEFDGQTGAVIQNNVVTLNFVDGGRGDADGVANGVIVDPGGPGSSTLHRIDQKYAKLPMQFEENRGQTDSPVKFLARGAGYNLFITNTSAVLTLAKPETGALLGPRQRNAAPRAKDLDVVAMNFVGANQNSLARGIGELPSRSNYFTGASSIIDVPNFARAQVSSLYQGIDVDYYTTSQGRLEFDFVVQPGANPRAIQMEFQGVNNAALDLGGNLQLDTVGSGRLVYQKPVLYQTVNGLQFPVVGSYVVQAGRIGIEVGVYNPALPLVIDPVLSYSTYLGGSGDDEGLAIAIDGAGSAYVTGKTLSTNFPTLNPYQGSYQGGSDVFVSRLNTAGDALVYSTYLGGSGNEQGNGITVDLAGNTLIAGTTASSNFPTTTDAYDSTANGSTDAFVSKLSATGDSLLYSSYLGGNLADTGTAVGVNWQGTPVITGDTAGGSFPRQGAGQMFYGGGATDAFVTSFGAGSSFFSTFLGGSGDDTAYGLATDSSGNVYVTGSTTGSFPTTSGVVQTTYGGGAADAFVTKVAAASGLRLYSTYNGGSGEDRGYAITLDRSNNAFIMGRAGSGFPTTTGAYQTTFGGGASDAFTTKLNSGATSRLYSTFLGGAGDDEGRGIDLTLGGLITLAGKTASTNFPTANPIQSTNAGLSDAFIARLDTAQSGSAQLTFSTYHGGSGNDQANGVAVDLLGHYYVAGTTQSTNLPVQGPYQSSNAGGADAFIAKVLDVPAPPVFTGITDDTGASATDRITTDQTITFSGTAPAGATVKINRRTVGEIASVSADPTTGAWSFNYTATTLAEGTHAFAATATVSGKTSPATKEFLVTVDRTGTSVEVSVPATTTSRAPKVRITARDPNNIPNGTQVRLDVDLNNDGDYLDATESNYTTGTVTDGTALIGLPLLAGAGTYRVRARVTDLAGNEGTSTDKTFTVTSATSYSIASAQVRTSDPLDGVDREQLGNVRLDHQLDLDLTPGGKQAGNPRFVYNSSSVSVRPIVQATIRTPNNASLPATIGVQLTWNGVAQGDPVYYSTTGLNPGDDITIAAQVNANVATTGRYPWSVTVFIPGSSNLTQAGTAFVRVEDGSPFSAGWTLSNVNRLHDIAADANGPAGKLWLYGTGGFRFFQGTSGTFTSPAEDNGTLVKNGDNTFTYTSPEQTKINFDTNGRQTNWVSADTKETISFAYDGSGRVSTFTAIDGSQSTFTYANAGNTILSSIAAPGSRTFTIAVTGTDLTQITDPDTRTHAFIYDGTTHRMTRDTRGALQNQYRYDTFGRTDQFTWGTTTSPTVTTIVPAAVRGLGALWGGDVEAHVTDALSHKTILKLDSAGRPLTVVAADGATTAYVRDTAGRITSMTDPLGRVTSYTRDAQGYVTREDLPGGAFRTWAYHATYHGVTTFTNERNHSNVSTYDSANGHLLTVQNTVTDVYANVTTPTTTYAYNATTGLVSTITDPEGRVTTMTYLGDSSRRLWKTTTQLGTDEIGYDANGHVNSMKDALLRQTTLSHDAMGRLLSDTDPAFKTETWVYNSSGLLESFTNKNNHKTKSVFDVYGRGLVEIVSEADASGVARTTISRLNNAGQADGSRTGVGSWTTLAFDPVYRTIQVSNAQGGAARSYFDLAGQLLENRDEIGNTTRYAYHQRGWVTQVTDARGKVTTNAYDNAGNRTSTTDPLNHAWSWEYDELHRARKATDPLTHFRTTVWWGDGRVKETKDARGFRTQHTYDFVNKKITTTEAVGTSKQRVTEQTVDAVGNVVSVKDPLNHVTSYQINHLNLVTKVTDPLLHETNFTRNSIGDVTKITDALLKDTNITYDELERQVKVTDPLNQTDQTVLDAVDQSVGAIDGLNNVEQQVFDSLGRNTFNVDPLAGLLKLEYAGNGPLLSLTDPVGNTTVYVRNELGQVTKEIDPLGKITVTAYDDAARVTSITDRLGRVREFVYFNNNILQTENWRNTAVGPIVWTRSFTYNENDQPLTATDNNGSYTWTYDELNRVATQVDPWAITLTYTRDAADRLTQVSDTKNGVRDYVYDDANRNTVRKFSGSGQTPARLDITWSDRDEVTELKRYTDLAGTNLIGKTLLGRDDAGRLNSIDHQDSGATTIDSYSYQLDAANRVTQQATFLDGTQNYTYDVTNQLTGDGTNNFSYDLNGNRTMTGYVTGAGNRLSTDGIWNFTYDDAGNLTKQVKIVGGETWNFAYNHLNQMTRVEKRSSDGGPITQLVEFKYDVLGNRIEKSVDADGDGPGTASVTRFAYDGPNAWADLNTSGTVLTRRLYLDGVDALFARISQTGQLDWYLTDHLGSVRDIIDNSGALQDHINYESYGKVLSETNPSYGDRFKFTGREVDSELYNASYHRARYYRFDIGAWQSEDPKLFSAGDANLRRYVGNGPINATDAFGRIASGIAAAGMQAVQQQQNSIAGGVAPLLGSFGGMGGPFNGLVNAYGASTGSLVPSNGFPGFPPNAGLNLGNEASDMMIQLIALQVAGGAIGNYTGLAAAQPTVVVLSPANLTAILTNGGALTAQQQWWQNAGCIGGTMNGLVSAQTWQQQTLTPLQAAILATSGANQNPMSPLVAIGSSPTFSPPANGNLIDGVSIPQNLGNVYGPYLNLGDAQGLLGIPKPPLGQTYNYAIFAYQATNWAGEQPNANENGMIPPDSILPPYTINPDLPNTSGQFDYLFYLPSSGLWLSTNHAVGGYPPNTQQWFLHPEVAGTGSIQMANGQVHPLQATVYYVQIIR